MKDKVYYSVTVEQEYIDKGERKYCIPYYNFFDDKLEAEKAYEKAIITYSTNDCRVIFLRTVESVVKCRNYSSKDPFGVFEIRLSIERNNSSILCEQERFNNFSDACRYVFMMNNYDGKKQYPDNYFNYFVVYNPIKKLYEKY